MMAAKDTDVDAVEEPEQPSRQERGVDITLVMMFLQEKAKTDEKLALQIEAATYRAAYESAIQH